MDKPPRRKRYAGTHPKKFAEKYKELAAEPATLAHVRAAGRTPAGTHVPVMVNEVLAALKPEAGDVVLDCTLGYGGHTEALAAVTGLRLIATDLDGHELARTTARLAAAGISVAAHHTNFAGIGNVLAAEGLAGVDCLLADLGLSSMQLDRPERGFGFKNAGPLDMRMDTTRGVTAAQLIADTDEEALAALLNELGDEPRAEAIAAAMKREMPQTTRDLKQLVLRAHGLDPSRYRKRSARDQHPAARVFQSLRMAVNRETANLEHLLRTLPYVLNAGGRAAIITFHSGEERRVREALTQAAQQGLFAAIDAEGRRPTHEEIHANPRARSARLFTARR